MVSDKILMDVALGGEGEMIILLSVSAMMPEH